MSVIPPHVVALCDYEDLANARLSDPVRAYVNGAAADGMTRDDNRAAWGRLRLQGRVLRPMKGAHTALSLLGLPLEHPILLAPVASHGLAHPEGEHATALGAAAAGAVMTVSTQAGLSLEAIAARAEGPLWFQLYMQPQRADTLQLVQRAAASGYRALVVTLDAPVSGLRNEEARAGFALPEALWPPNLAGMATAKVQHLPGRAATFLGLLDSAPDWLDLAWLIDQSPLPVVVKGITSTKDARQAVAAGVAGLVVSNHGGRVLDSLPATAEILPRVVRAAAGRVPVLCDGGIRRGTDVLKALALGASAVMVGRPQIHALSVAGAAGVAHMISLLRAELEVAMALTGCTDLGQIGPDVLWSEHDTD